MSIKNQKILVTGGKGFIGLHLVKKLRKLGAKVEVYDISVGQNIENLEKVNTFVKRKYDIIYHLAGFSGNAESNREKLKCFKINTIATVNLFESIIKYSSRTKIILSSSRLEYGQAKKIPVDEKSPTNPTSMYGLSRLLSTQIAFIFRDLYGLKVTIFRTSNVYGPHKSSKFSGYNVVNHFIDLAKHGDVITIYGDGEQKRDYIYIDDLINAFLLGADDKASGQVYNVGSGKGIRFKDMAEIIVKNVGKGRTRLVKWPENYRNVETGSYVSDISKIKKDLGFNPKVSFKSGLDKVLKIIN